MRFCVLRFAIEKSTHGGGAKYLRHKICGIRLCTYKCDRVYSLRTYKYSLPYVDLEHTFIVTAVVCPLGEAGNAPLPYGAGLPARARAVGNFGHVEPPGAWRLRANSRSFHDRSGKYRALGVGAASMHPNREYNGNK